MLPYMLHLAARIGKAYQKVAGLDSTLRKKVPGHHTKRSQSPRWQELSRHLVHISLLFRNIAIARILSHKAHLFGIAATSERNI
jgi:hypothetical protein